jgi:MFS family permease
MAVTTRTEGFRTLLKKKNFVRLWLAQLISMTIFNASNYALLVLIEIVTGSTTLVGLAIICFSVPAVLLGAPAGVYVDRMHKKRVLWGSNILRAVATLAFVISLLINQHQLIPIYLITIIISCIGQFFSPAEGSTIPMLVSDEELMPALSLFNITFMLSQALGFILLAPIVLSLLPTFSIAGVTITPVVALYTIVAVLYGVCAVLTALIPKHKFNCEKRDECANVKTSSLEIVTSIGNEMLQGWSFVRRSKRLFLSVIQLSFAGVLLLVIGELATPIVTKLLDLPANDMAFVFAPAGIGLVAGSIMMPNISRFLGKSRTILIGAIALTVITTLLPLTVVLAKVLQPHGWSADPLLLVVVAFLMLLAGFALDFINIPSQTSIQEHTPDWIKGRVLALQLMLYNAFSIPVILFIGVVADLFGIDHVLYLMSIALLAFGIWGIYYEHKHQELLARQQEALDNKEEERNRDRVAL